MITAIFLINFNDPASGLLMSELMRSLEKCPQVDKAQLTGQVVDIQLEYS